MVNHYPIVIRFQLVFVEFLFLAENLVQYLTWLSLTIICWQKDYVYFLKVPVQIGEIVSAPSFLLQSR